MGIGIRLATAVAVCFVAASALAVIDYTVKPLPEDNQVAVRMVIPVGKGPVELRIPNWAPGSYRLSDYYKGIKFGSAVDDQGAELVAIQPEPHIWQFSPPPGSKTLTVTYNAPVLLADGAMHYSGPSTYLYVEGRKHEPCRLTLDLPTGWRSALGLDELKGTKSSFSAKTYDVLADNPVTMGDFLMDTYTVQGKPHIIAMRNPAKSKVDRAYLIKACKFVTEIQSDFFGGLPYNKYVWHFSVNDAPDGAGGLEHLSSTQISLASGVGPRAVSVLSHEFFHLWNVKRIRSLPLGPFDYNVLPKTGALWWLEGVTDYYAHYLLYRYGWWDRRAFEADVQQNMNSTNSNPARLEVSPYEASYRVAEAANGRGNSSGYRVNYYNTGWLCGMLLDIEIRVNSDSKHSLDDVMKGLWNQCRNDKPGFAEDDIRKLCVKFGGAKSGEFYDRIIMKPGQLPIEEQLAKVGMSIAQVEETYTEYGFAYRSLRSDGGLAVTAVNDQSATLKVGDIVTSINGVALDVVNNFGLGQTARTELSKTKPGQVIQLQVKRESENLTVSVTPKAATRMVNRIADKPGAPASAVRIRTAWLQQKKI